MFSRKRAPEVLVAGAGPVGQFCALCLARQGIDVEIVDEEWRPSSHSYATALHPASIDLLAQAGLAEELHARCLKIGSMGFYEGVERRAELDFSQLDVPHPYLALLPQDQLELLLEEALKAVGIKVRWNHRVARFEQDRDGVDIAVDELTKDSVGYAVSHTEWMVRRSRELHVPFVIGADGHRSLLRRQLEIEFQEIAEPEFFAVFELKTDAALPAEVRVVLDLDSTSVMWPLPEGRCRWSFQTREMVASESTRVKDRLLFQLGLLNFPGLSEDRLHGLLAERAPWFEGEVEEVEWRMAVRFERRLAASFGRGRIWLAGDAAHMTGPVGIQSMNVGLREAKLLADAIAKALRGTTTLAGLEEYGHSRKSEWRELLGLEGGLRADSDSDPWIASYAGRLMTCLPGSAEQLTALAQSLGLKRIPIGSDAAPS